MLDHGTSGPSPVVVAFPPEINASYTRYVFDPLYAAITSGASVVVVDLSATVACDLVSVYGLIRARDWASTRQVRFRLVIPPGASLRRMLELLGLDGQLALYSSVAEAERFPGAPIRPQPPYPPYPPYPPWPPWPSPDARLGGPA